MKTTLAVLLLMALAPAAGVAVSPPVQVADGRVQARLDGADLTEVLLEVARQAGLEVHGALTAPRPLSIALDAVPLEEALARLLEGQSFALTYAGDRVKGVKLLGRGDAVLTFVPGGTAPAPEETPEEAESGPLAASHRQVPLGGRLARAVGADSTNFSDIMGVAMQGPDPRTRTAALRQGLRILDSEPELQASVLQTLDGIDDVALASWLTKIAGEHAAGVAHETARSATTGSLRQRAAAVERQLRVTPAPGR